MENELSKLLERVVKVIENGGPAMWITVGLAAWALTAVVVRSAFKCSGKTAFSVAGVLAMLSYFVTLGLALRHAARHETDINLDAAAFCVMQSAIFSVLVHIFSIYFAISEAKFEVPAWFRSLPILIINFFVVGGISTYNFLAGADSYHIEWWMIASDIMVVIGIIHSVWAVAKEANDDAKPVRIWRMVVGGVLRFASVIVGFLVCFVLLFFAAVLDTDGNNNFFLLNLLASPFCLVPIYAIGMRIGKRNEI